MIHYLNQFFIKLILVEKPENNNTEISLESAKAISSEKELGDEILQPLPTFGSYYF